MTHMTGRLLVLTLAFMAGASAQPLDLVWPTSNSAWTERKPLEAYVQHAGSGEAESGTFGGVRTGGAQFHEGLDIKCAVRDRRGEPQDAVYAAMNGVVRHVSSRPGNSSYGRYVVLEHPQHAPAVYTLYAHLSRIAPGLSNGIPVKAGQELGTVGYSADRPFPKERAHLHFELGLMVTNDFQRWYNARKFGSRNEHGVWNGMNLLGVDPLQVFDDWRSGRIATMQDVFRQMPEVARVRIATLKTPDFVTRYPSLLTKPVPLGPVAGWEISFGWTGLPFAWTPLTAAEVVGLPRGKPQIVSADTATDRRERSKSIAVKKRGTWVPGKDLETVLQQLFGSR